MFNSCILKNLGNCGATEGNDSIKFIGISFNVYNQGRHWFNISHDSSQNVNPYFWVYEGHGESFIWMTQNDYKAAYPQSNIPLEIQKGKWETFEYYTNLSTVPASQGGTAQTRIYKNGKLILERTNYRTINNNEMEADYLYLLEYWNGGAPASQSVYFDDIIMTNKTPKKRDENGKPFLGQD